MDKHITEYAGLDLGDQTSMLHIIDQAGSFLEEATKTAISLKTPGLFMSVTLKDQGAG